MSTTSIQYDDAVSRQGGDYNNNDDDDIVDYEQAENYYYNTTRSGPYPDHTVDDENNNQNNNHHNNDCDSLYRVVCPISSSSSSNVVQKVIQYDTEEQQRRQYYYNNNIKQGLDDDERTYPAETSFDSQYQRESSLAGRDSLALEEEPTDESIILEHPLPNTARKAERRRYCMYGLAWILFVGIITVTALFAIQNNNDDDRSATNDESKVGSSSIESDNIFDSGLLPEAYYLLEPKVYNATALLDPNTPAGQAFKVVTSEDDVAYNAADQTSTGLNLIQRYSLLTLFFGAGKKQILVLIVIQINLFKMLLLQFFLTCSSTSPYYYLLQMAGLGRIQMDGPIVVMMSVPHGMELNVKMLS